MPESLRDPLRTQIEQALPILERGHSPLLAFPKPHMHDKAARRPLVTGVYALLCSRVP